MWTLWRSLKTASYVGYTRTLIVFRPACYTLYLFPCSGFAVDSFGRVFGMVLKNNNLEGIRIILHVDREKAKEVDDGVPTSFGSRACF
jgi:hypothetical protein